MKPYRKKALQDLQRNIDWYRNRIGQMEDLLETAPKIAVDRKGVYHPRRYWTDCIRYFELAIESAEEWIELLKEKPND